MATKTTSKTRNTRSKTSSKPTAQSRETKRNTTRKNTNKPPLNTISFVNEHTSKAITHTATYNGNDTIDFSMTLTEMDGKPVTGSLPITDVKQILKTNYNIAIIGFCIGIYTFEFDRGLFEKWIKDNKL